MPWCIGGVACCGKEGVAVCSRTQRARFVVALCRDAFVFRLHGFRPAGRVAAAPRCCGAWVRGQSPAPRCTLPAQPPTPTPAPPCFARSESWGAILCLPKEKRRKERAPGEGAGCAGPRPFCRARGWAKAAPAASALIGTSLSRSPLRSPDRPAPSNGENSNSDRTGTLFAFRAPWGGPSSAARTGVSRTRCPAEGCDDKDVVSDRPRAREQHREPAKPVRALGCAFFGGRFFAQAKKGASPSRAKPVLTERGSRLDNVFR